MGSTMGSALGSRVVDVSARCEVSLSLLRQQTLLKAAHPENGHFVHIDEGGLHQRSEHPA